MKIVFLGKPQSGKGTQSHFLSERLKVPHISTGDILREEVKRKSPTGNRLKHILEKGELVQDSLILSIVKKRLTAKGFILDGFPRTIGQAEALEKIQPVDLVIDIYCPDATIITRAAARRVCPTCGRIYGIDLPPKKPGVCDRCGQKLVRRPDDRKETVRHRLRVYQKQTAPLVKFYRHKGVYVRIDGTRPIPVVHKEILRKIETVK